MPRWTWKKMSEWLTAKGYLCFTGRSHGFRYYSVIPPGADDNSKTMFDTVEEVRDAYGFGDPLDQEEE